MKTKIEEMDGRLVAVLEGEFVMKNVNEDIMSVFKMTGFVELFEFEQA